MDNQDQRSEESLDCINTCCVVMTVSRILFGFLLRLQIRMILVLEHGLDVTTDQGKEQGDTETGRDQVEEGGLGVFVDVHHEDSQQKSSQVRKKCGVKIEVGFPF